MIPPQNNFNIYNLFEQAASKNPSHTAIISKGESISFGNLAENTNCTSQYFLSKGIGKGDRVLVFVPMSIDLYRIVLGLIKIGAVAVFIDEWVSRKRMNTCCSIANCKAFIGIPKARLFAIFFNELRKVPIHLGLNYKRVKETFSIPITTNDDSALITFTTGSTGTPKAAKRSHEFLYYQFLALQNKIPSAKNEVCMVMLPIVLMINLASGITSLIPDGKVSELKSFRAGKIVEQIIENKVSSIVSSPSFIKQVAAFLLGKKIALPIVQKIITGGAPVFPSEARLFISAFEQADIEVVYGSTEAEPISSIHVKELECEEISNERGLHVGKIDPLTEVKIIPITDKVIQFKNGIDLQSYSMPLHAIGEIIVSGDHVLKEYFNNKEAFMRNKIIAGDKCWHRTGDSGYIAEDNSLYLTGRCNTLIIKTDRTWYPFIYENIFLYVQGIEIGTILLLNDKVTAVLELKKGVDRIAILKNIRALPNPIDGVIILKKIPKDPRHSSKIDYEKLKQICNKKRVIENNNFNKVH